MTNFHLHLSVVLILFFFCSISSVSSQFSLYDQTIIPFSIYNADGNPNNLITNSKTLLFLRSFV